ncbi:MAG: DGQHR domain-containing protein [Candidatus Obscuribacterales bacterium]|nr:DGQHR domain-containing protein [Candidatus Obscuribacterales bacterium]
MKKDAKGRRLLLPALRGSMGDWIYYVCIMKMSDIADRVQPVADIHETQTLSDYIQRQLQEGHSDLIKGYLLSQQQRLFNALVIGVYGGSPEWCEVAVRRTDKSAKLDDQETELAGVLGFLSLDGGEELFAIDGQHRVVGIQKALAEDRELGDEEIACLFVAHSKTQIGTERTRRLFTVLNRHAKAVSTMELIALDDDDVIAIITRRLIDNYSLFQDKIYIKKTKNIPASDDSSVTSIVALYDALNDFFKEKRNWNVFKRERPADDVIAKYYGRAVSVLDVLQKNMPALAEVAKSKTSAHAVKKYRTAQGGHLIFRPIGFQLILQSLKLLMEQGISLDDSVKRLSKVPWELSQEPWSGLLWNPVGKRMITAKENQKAALKVIAYGVGLDLKTLNSTKTALQTELDNLQSGIKPKKYV